LDLLTRLVDKSLVVVDGPEEDAARYRLLETIRQYGRDKLAESGESERTRNRHLNYFLKWAIKTEASVFGPESRDSLNRFEIEHDNIRAALEWSQRSQTQDGAALGLRLAAASGIFWFLRSHLS